MASDPFSGFFGGGQPQQGGGTWDQIFQLLPLILGAAQSGKAGFGPFMEGWQRADEQLKQHEMGKARLGMEQSRLGMEQQRIAGEEQDRRFREQQTIAAAAEHQRQVAAALEEQQRKEREAIESRIVAGLPQMTSKEEYDPFISAHETLANVPANTFRTKYPFTAPKVEKRAEKAWQKIQSGPFKDKLQPDLPVRFDRDGDGIAEEIPLGELAQLAGVVPELDHNGVLQWPSKDMTDTDKADAEGAFADLLAQAKAEGKNVTDPKVRNEIRDKANKQIALARRLEHPTDPGKADEANAIADAIIEGKQPPEVTRLYSQGPAVRAALQRKGFDLTKASMDWQAVQKWTTTANGTQQTRMRQAVDNASHALDVIDELAAEWEGGKFPALNKGRLMAAKQGVLGPKAQTIATKLEAQISDITSELGNVYMGGNSPTDHALTLAAKNLSADWSKPQLTAAIGLARQNLKIRQNSMANVGPVSAGGSENRYAPPTQAAPAAPGTIRKFNPATGKLE